MRSRRTARRRSTSCNQASGEVAEDSDQATNREKDKDKFHSKEKADPLIARLLP
jgi:hypothetical protein